MTLELVAGEQNPLVRGVVTGIYRSVSYRGAGCGEIGGAAQVELLPGRPGNRWLTIRYEGGHSWRWHMRREIETRIDELLLRLGPPCCETGADG